MESAKTGEKDAFNSLSKIIRQISYSYFYSKYSLKKIRNKDDVDDLTNDVFLSFAEQFHNIDNVEFWLRRVLFLTFVNWYKKQKQSKITEFDETFFMEPKNNYPGSSVDYGEILKVINKLSPDKQSILKMRFWEELKFQEIAEKLRKNEAAVKKMFYRTIEEIKSRL